MKKTKKPLFFCLSIVMLLSLLYTASVVTQAKSEETNNYGLSNPRIDNNGITTWDCIYFGNYWQNDTNGDGVVNKNDEKQPIRWRILSIDGDNAFLLADQNLEYQPYNANKNLTNATWETCTLRQWLNNDFFQNAFDINEQNAVQITAIDNNDNPEFGTDGGNDTTDMVYLLSIQEAKNPAYGFTSSTIATKTRKAENTKYAELNDYSPAFWWLRTAGSSGSYAAYVTSEGGIMPSGDSIAMSYIAVRPVLHLNLSSDTWRKTNAVSTSYSLSEPKVGNTTTWDCIYFGYYWQNDTNGDGIVNKNDAKLPIKWRVLSVNGDEAFLLADQNLDCKKYNNIADDVTWGPGCSLWHWLNSNFYNDAFNILEKRGIFTDEYGKGVSLLSDVDATNTAFGFGSSFTPGFGGNYYAESDTRQSQNTEYAKEQGAVSTWWWLCTQGENECKALAVDDDGCINPHGNGVDEDNVAVRPSLHLNLAYDEWCKAGTVSSSGEVTDNDIVVPTARPVPTATPDIKEDTTPNPEPTIPSVSEENSQEIYSIKFDYEHLPNAMVKGTVATIPRPQFFYLKLKTKGDYSWEELIPIPLENSKNENLIWTSSNPEICTVDENGTIYAKNYGIANITAKTKNGKYDTFDIKVCKPSLSRLSTIPGSTVLELNETDKYKVSYIGKNRVTWRLSKKNILKIEEQGNDKIKLRAIKPGKVTLYATIDGLTLKRNIKVLKPRLELKKLVIKRGKMKSTYVISSGWLSIKWKCKNKKIISLSNNDPDIEIKGKKKGKTWVIGKIRTKGIKYKPTLKIRVIVK